MAKRIVLLMLLVGIVLAAFNYKTILGWITPAKTINNVEVKILLKEDPDFNTLLITLQGKNVVEDLDEVRKIAASIELDTANLAGGKFVILPGAKIEDVLKGFEKDENGRGKNEEMVSVYFNSCRDMFDVASQISLCIAADSTSLIEYFHNPETLQKYGFTKAQLPALIIPKMYEMEFDTDAKEFVEFMALQFREFWTEERKNKLAKVGLSAPSQAVTLASIVYSEQGKIEAEWPIIAKLYLNRLNKGIKLQSDPTFKYCWGSALDGVQRLTSKHRDKDCPYNTYLYSGLPPGPICITPASVVDAVLNPADVDYIFMCAKPDYSGEHNFTKSDNEHVKNARAYQKWLSEHL